MVNPSFYLLWHVGQLNGLIWIQQTYRRRIWVKEKLKRRTPVLEAKEGLKSSGASSSDLGNMPALLLYCRNQNQVSLNAQIFGLGRRPLHRLLLRRMQRKTNVSQIWWRAWSLISDQWLHLDIGQMLEWILPSWYSVLVVRWEIWSYYSGPIVCSNKLWIWVQSKWLNSQNGIVQM